MGRIQVVDIIDNWRYLKHWPYVLNFFGYV